MHDEHLAVRAGAGPRDLGRDGDRGRGERRRGRAVQPREQRHREQTRGVQGRGGGGRLHERAETRFYIGKLSLFDLLGGGWYGLIIRFDKGLKQNISCAVISFSTFVRKMTDKDMKFVNDYTFVAI